MARPPGRLPAPASHSSRPFFTAPENHHHRLGWECHLLAVKLTLDVVIEEIKVQHCLDDASNPHDPITVALLRHVAPHPVEQVERTVHTHAEHVVPRQHVGNLPAARIR